MKILPELENFCFKKEPINYSELLSFLLCCSYYADYLFGYIELSAILFEKIVDCSPYTPYMLTSHERTCYQMLQSELIDILQNILEED